MRYIVAGYVVVLSLLFLYAVQLAWRRRRLTLAVARVAAGASGSTAADASGATGVPASGRPS